MRKLIFIALAMSTVSACATLPKGAGAPAVPPARIIEAIHCQLAGVFAPGQADPAGLGNWGALATLTTTVGSSAVVQPSLVGIAGTSGIAKWKAPTASTKFDDSVTRKSVVEYLEPRLDRVAASGTCNGTADGLDVGPWLRASVAGMPASGSGAAPTSLSYERTYAVTASAGGGLTFAAADFSLTLEGNSRSHSNTYKVNIQFTKPQQQTFGLRGAEDELLEALRAQRDEDEDKETTITVAPGQTIIIQ